MKKSITIRLDEDSRITLIKTLMRGVELAQNKIKSLENDSSINKRRGKELIKEHKREVRVLEYAIKSLGIEGE